MRGNRFYVDRKTICAALLLVALIPVALAVSGVVRHWEPLPYWDEWRTPGLLLTNYAQGKLRLSDFFLQHNEARMVFPCILYFILANVHGWDMRDVMAVTLFEDAAVCGLILLLFLRTTGATVITALAAFAVATFLCFSPVQYENFLSGFLFAPFVPGLATVSVAVVNLSRFRFGIKTTINAVVALIATYTFANGMLLWIFGLPLPAAQESASKRSRFACYSIFASTAFVSIAGYFINYEHPPSHPPFHFGIVQSAHYLILWVGSYFNSAETSPLAVGLVVLALWIVALTITIRLLVCGAQWRHFYPWLLISLYGLSSGLITAMGRVGFGVQQALSSRYAIFSLFIYLGLVGTTFALYSYEQDQAVLRRRRWIIGLATGVIALAVPAWCFSFLRGEQLMIQVAQRSARLLCAFEWIDAFPENPDLKLIFPFVNVLRIRAHTVVGAGLLHCHLLSPRLLDQLKEPQHSSDASHGQLEAATVRDNTLITSGWIPSSPKKPNCALIALRKPTGQLALMSVVAATISRPDIERRYQHERMKPVEFWDQIPLSMPAEGIIEAWAVDASAEVAWPLAGSTSLIITK
jgi:hypothetical protein